MAYAAMGVGAVEALASALGNSVSPVALDALQAAVAARTSGGTGADGIHAGTFGGLVTEALKQVNQSQFDGETAIQNLALGREKNLHAVMIAMTEADLSMQFVMAIRNKVIDAYQEVSRMQI